MSVKAKPVKEDPETTARREAAEARADAGRIEDTQSNLSEDTRAVVRNFGRLSAFAGQPGVSTPFTVPGSNLKFANNNLRGARALAALRSR